MEITGWTLFFGFIVIVVITVILALIINKIINSYDSKNVKRK